MKFLCSVVTIAVAVNMCGSLPYKTVPLRDPTNAAFDYLSLSMNYRAGLCCYWNSNCTSPDNSFHPRWTIHGLWPSSNAGGGPSNCRTQTRFDMNALGRIRGQMNESWPSFKNSSPESFWKHEFDKHGSCAIYFGVKNVTNVTTYFKTALDLNAGYNITKYLAGITPSNDAPVALWSLQDVVSRNFKRRAEFYCGGTKNDLHILQEIRLCFNKNLQPQDCPRKTNCKTARVWYLKNGATSVTFSIVILALFAVIALVNQSPS